MSFNSYTSIDLDLCLNKDYSNEAVLADIPYNHVYRFRVAVYGVNFTGWSDFSDASSEVDMKIRKTYYTYYTLTRSKTAVKI